MTDRFFKLSEVQKMLGVSRCTLWRWTSENGLKVVRVGGVVRVRETDLLAFINRHESSAGEDRASVYDGERPSQ